MHAKTVVLGAGIVGVLCAVELAKAGHEVVLVDASVPGGPQAASYGNGAWISPASVVPMSMPGLWRKLPSYLLDGAGPLTIRWSALPRLTPWLLRFLLAGSSTAKVERTARALGTLIGDAPERHAALADEIGRPDLVCHTGLLYAYPSRADFEAEALAWRLRRDNNVVWRELGEGELRDLEPALGPRYRFGALVESGAHCFDPGAYVAALAEYAGRLGVRMMQARATGFAFSGKRLRAVVTEEGDLPCDRAVIACGIGSASLARGAGDRIPLQSERGYHAVLEDAPVKLRTPIMPSDGKMANTTTAGGLRIAGQVELASVDAEPNWQRVEILLRHAARTYPGLGPREGWTVRRWMGHRPSLPDGLPAIGRSARSPDILYAFGHGHVGLAAAPATAALVRTLAEDAETTGAAPFDPARFR